jgi:hypothetical protein
MLQRHGAGAGDYSSLATGVFGFSFSGDSFTTVQVTPAASEITETTKITRPMRPRTTPIAS